MSNKIKQNYVDNILLGENSYSGVLYRINEVIKNAQAKTVEGSEFLSQMYKSLNESVTPLLSLKPFITKGEELAPDDMTVGEVMKQVKKHLGQNADLNFIINLCKEEHFAKMMRAGIPAEETVKTIKEFFNKKSSETEKLIKDGIFDCLQSDLLGDIKKQLGCNENEGTDESDPEKQDKEVKTAKLNENMFIAGMNGVSMYAPVGFIHQDSTGQNYGYTEGTFVRLNESGSDNEAVDVAVVRDLEQKHFKLMRAVDEIVFNPETNEFTPKEKWDMNIKVTADGDVIVTLPNGNTKKIKQGDLQKLFIETINEYERDPKIGPKFSEPVKKRYMRDADNFCTIAMNIKNLVKFNTMTAVKSINESALYEIGTKAPKLLRLNGQLNVNYDSFKQLCESQTSMKDAMFGLFDKNLNEEQKFFKQRETRLVNLNEKQKEINKELESIARMKSVAEPNSPAMVRLMEMEEKYNTLLDQNITDIKEAQEDHLY